MKQLISPPEPILTMLNEIFLNSLYLFKLFLKSSLRFTCIVFFKEIISGLLHSNHYQPKYFHSLPQLLSNFFFIKNIRTLVLCYEMQNNLHYSNSMHFSCFSNVLAYLATIILMEVNKISYFNQPSILLCLSNVTCNIPCILIINLRSSKDTSICYLYIIKGVHFLRK